MKHVGGQSKGSFILNSGLRWMEMSGQLNDQEDLRQGKVFWYTININLLWSRSRSFGEEKDLSPHTEIEIRILCFATPKLANTLTEIRDSTTSFHKVMVMVKNSVTFKDSECIEFKFSITVRVYTCYTYFCLQLFSNIIPVNGSQSRLAIFAGLLSIKLLESASSLL